MVNRTVWVSAGVLAAGAAIAWFVFRADGDSDGALDAPGQALVTRVAAERARSPLDAAACRKLLLDLGRHPQGATHGGLIRGQAWLHLLLGRTDKAWAAIEANIGIDAEPEDLLVAALTLKRRHAEGGVADHAQRASVFAEEHYDATGQASSQLLAWQMAVRAGDEERRVRLVKASAAGDPATAPARLVAALSDYPNDVRASDRSVLEDLERTLVELPEELELGLAWLQVGDGEPEVNRAGLARAEGVLRTFQSSIMARTLAGTAVLRLKQWDDARERFLWLVQRYPDHRLAPTWRGLLEVAERTGARK